MGACSTWCLTIHNYLLIWKAAFVCPETLDKSKFVFTEFACGILFSCKASDYSPLSKVYQARKASRYGGPYLHPLFPSFPDFRAFLALILTISHQREICEDVFQRFKRPRRYRFQVKISITKKASAWLLLLHYHLHFYWDFPLRQLDQQYNKINLIATTKDKIILDSGWHDYLLEASRNLTTTRKNFTCSSCSGNKNATENRSYNRESSELNRDCTSKLMQKFCRQSRLLISIINEATENWESDYA